MRRGIRFLLTFLFVLCAASPAMAVVIHDESVDGDLPQGNLAAYPVFSVTPGSNVILAEAGVYPDKWDAFYLDLTGYRLDSVVLIVFPNPANGWNLGFSVVYNQSAMGTSVDSASLLNSDLLPLLTPTYGPGFSFPIANDLYRFEIGAGMYTASYGLDFRVSEVPLPSSLFLFLTALPWLLSRRKWPSRPPGLHA